jgi:hypothetical protein
VKPEKIDRTERAPGVRKELKKQSVRNERREGKKLTISKREYRGYSL